MQESTDKPIIKETTLDASPARVWRALTHKEELKQWCFDMNDFRPEAGFAFQFYGEKGDTKFLHLCRVIDAEKEKGMKWRWTYEGVPGETFVQFELIPQGEKTLLRLTHEGLDSLPQDENYARQNFVEGWNYILDRSLKEYLENVKCKM
jgi:uncharacterized protein YndB with AHSA1/START domain